MARRRFYAPPDKITASEVTLSTHETHHLIHVLRMTPGDQAFVFDGCGREYRCSFRRVEHNRAQLEIADQLSDVVESPNHLTLAQALAKGEKFDFIIQKATELGVSAIAPLITRYADVRLDEEQTTKRVERWRRISLEAMKQCGRRKLVEITAPCTLLQFVAEPAPSLTELAGAAPDAQRVLLLFSEKGGMTITDALSDLTFQGPISALIGPEGGWSDDEIETLDACGSKAVSLGPRILRTETAAIVAITLIQHAMGDLSRPVPV
jgi:16S rRNA (uracil1498-N3)-methyltransferase